MMNFKYQLCHYSTDVIISDNFYLSYLNNLDISFIIITDQNIFEIYGDKWRDLAFCLDILIINPGENSKNLSEYQNIIKKIHEISFNKNNLIVAIGGGVVTDLAAFVAATYQRGCQLTFIPTTLIGQIDASIGGKCGLNFSDFKNQIGTFYHPQNIIIDSEFLNTLPKREFNSGISECIKYAFLYDSSILNIISAKEIDLIKLIEKCIKAKLYYVEQDNFDQNIRMSLNFGHTFGHLIETLSNFSFTHGEAIAWGMLLELNDTKLRARLRQYLNKYGLLKKIPAKYDFESFINTDKKYSNDKITLVKLENIGTSTLERVSIKEIKNELLWQKYSN